MTPPFRYALPWEAVYKLCTTRQVAALMMWQYGAMTYQQIAERLGCSEKTVRTDIKRALSAVGPRLEVDGEQRSQADAGAGESADHGSQRAGGA